MGMTSVRLKSEEHWRGTGSESQVGVEGRSLRCSLVQPLELILVMNQTPE